jgi:hypothetical protein
VEAGGGGDHHRLDGRVGQQLGRVGGGERRAQRGGQPLGRPGAGSATPASRAPGTRRARVSPWKAPISPAR